jgi:methionine--tRNA ligase beta chain
MISLEDFQKLDLRIGKVVAAERIADTEKLLKLEVDLGSEKRQLVAGVGGVYQPEALAGKEIVVVANLEPKIIKDIESQGMLLAADDPNGPVLLVPEKSTEPGTKIK